MNRVVKYDLLRILSCFAIVLLHVSNGYWYVVQVESRDFVIMTIYNSFTRFGVPVFLMLSGMFLLNPEKEMPIKKWASRIWKLIVVFFLWSLFYAFQSVIYNGVLHGWDSVTQEMWSDALTRLLNGHGHMWFLKDLLGFYLLLPVLRKICEDIKITGYFLLLWIIVRFMITTMLPQLCGGVIYDFTTSLHLYMLTGYIGYFMAGYYLNSIDIPKSIRYLLYASGVGALVFTMVKTISVCRESMTYDDMWFSPSNVNVLILTAAVFVLFKYMQIPSCVANARWVVPMSKATFFVYMIHPFFLEKLQLVGITVIAYPTILSIPIMTVAIFAVGILTGWLTDKIPVIGKWITFR